MTHRECIGIRRHGSILRYRHGQYLYTKLVRDKRGLRERERERNIPALQWTRIGEPLAL